MDPGLIAELANHDLSHRKEGLEMLGVKTFKDMASIEKETLRARLHFKVVEVTRFESLRDICIDKISARNQKPQPARGAHLFKPGYNIAARGAGAPINPLYPWNQGEPMMTETGFQSMAHASYPEFDKNPYLNDFNLPVGSNPKLPSELTPPQAGADGPIAPAEALMREIPNDENCYAIRSESPKKGMGLIIMNDKFEGQGVKEEGKTLHSLFTKMGLEICLLTNRKRGAIISEANKIASMNHCKLGYSLVAVGICTQCEEGDKLNAKDEAYSFEKDLKPIFKPTNCPGLEGKPKIFFINSCNPVKEVCDDGLDNVTQSTEESDFLVVHSTVTRGKGFTSFNCCFIAHLEKTFEAHRGQYHLMDIIMIAVDNCKPVEAEGAGSKKYTQKCRRNSTLTKDVFIPK